LKTQPKCKLIVPHIAVYYLKTQSQYKPLANDPPKHLW